MDLVFEAMKKEEEQALARLMKQKMTSQLPSSLRTAAATCLSRHPTSQDGSPAATALVAVVAPPRPLAATAAAAEKVGSHGAPTDDHHHHQDDHDDQDSLQARINRDVTNMDSDVLALRLASMTSLFQSLESLTVVVAAVTNNKHTQSVLETHYKAIFKRLGDPSESCRRLAIRLCSFLFQHGGQQAFSSVLLAHFFPALRERLLCRPISYDKESQLFVHDRQAHAEYLRGKTTVVRQDKMMPATRLPEPSEEIRLELCQLLHQLVNLSLQRDDAALALRPHFYDLVVFFHCQAQDQFPEVQVASCSALSTLASSSNRAAPAFQLGVVTFALALVRGLMPLLRHRLAKVRVASLDAIRDIVQCPDLSKRKGGGTEAIVELVGFRADNVLPIGTFYDGKKDVTVNYLAELSQDPHPTVRKHLVLMLTAWLTLLPDRYDHETRLLPYLLNCLNDNVQEIQSLALQSLSTCGDLYAKENEAELAEQQYTAAVQGGSQQEDLAAAAGSATGHLSSFSLATKLYVRRNTKRILPVLIEELCHWKRDIRLSSVKLLRVLIMFHEDSLIDNLPLLLPGLLKALALAEAAALEEEREPTALLCDCAELLATFIPVSSIRDIIATIPSSLFGSSSSSSHEKVKRLLLGRYFQKGAVQCGKR